MSSGRPFKMPFPTLVPISTIRLHVKSGSFKPREVDQGLGGVCHLPGVERIAAFSLLSDRCGIATVRNAR